jgi:putative sterol carrier protein
VDQQITADEAIASMPGYLDSEKAGSLDKKIQINLSGDDGGTWWLKIRDGKAESGRGEIEDPDLTLSASSADYVQIVTGKLDGASAFMSGRLRVKGDMTLAVRFGTLFRRPA